MTMLDVSFLKSNPNHDARGRFTTADDAAAAAGDHGAETFARAVPHAADGETRRSAIDLGRDVLHYLHDAAANLAAKATHVVRSSRITALNPTAAGGIAIKTVHGLPGDAGHIEARLQIHPWDVADQRVKAAIAATHRGLLAMGRRIVPSDSRANVTFKNGPAPTSFTEK